MIQLFQQIDYIPLYITYATNNFPTFDYKCEYQKYYAFKCEYKI